MKGGEYIFQQTGNPFVDAGIFALCAWANKQNPEKLTLEDIQDVIQLLPNVYPRWKKLINIFTINAKMLNPSVKDRKDREARFTNFLNELIAQIKPVQPSGTCLGCGARDVELNVGREVYPLTGSGDLLNWFSFFEPGLPLCSACVLAAQLVPLILIARNGRFALVHSHNPRFMHIVAKRIVEYVRKQLAADKPGCYHPNWADKVSDEVFIVRLICDFVLPEAEVFGNTSVRVYLFVNSGQQNALSYLDMPAPVFNFVEKAKLGGLTKKLREWFGSDGRERDICRSLLNEDSMIWSFIDRQNRKVIGGWQLFQLYLEEVEAMEPQRLEVLKSVGQRLYKHLKATNFKQLQNLETDDYREFMTTLTRLQRDTLIYELDEFNLLFPEGKSWVETQRLLLGYIYELIHKEGKIPAAEESGNNEK